MTAATLPVGTTSRATRGCCGRRAAPPTGCCPPSARGRGGPSSARAGRSSRPHSSTCSPGTASSTAGRPGPSWPRSAQCSSSSRDSSRSRTTSGTPRSWLASYLGEVHVGRRALGLTRYGAVADTLRLLEKEASPSGLFPRFLGRGTPQYALNGGCDSFYEYLLKVWVLGGGSEAWLLSAYRRAVGGVQTHLVMRGRRGVSYLGEMHGTRPVGTMEHLTCFAPGMLGERAACFFLQPLPGARDGLWTGGTLD